MSQSTATIDPERVQEFALSLFGDLGATVSAAMIYLGDKLGLYRALAAADGPMTAAELATRTETAERYVREWLGNQCASGYVHYDAKSRTYTLPPEHAAVLADEDSPAFMVGGFVSAAGVFQMLDKLEGAFRTGEGIGWEQHDHRMFCGTARFFAPTYRHFLVQEWIPALDGVEQRLKDGARIADVGCGHGHSTMLLAHAFPNSTVDGFDVHDESIRTARAEAERAGLAERVRFATARAQDFRGTAGYDLIAFFDCLHDMGDPISAARHARESLAPGGTLMLVEPRAGDELQDNLNPVGRAYYGFSTMICTPASLAQEGRLGLGAQAGEARLREVLEQAGFSHVRRATETPFNMVLEARA